jgi:hypothetical protein
MPCWASNRQPADHHNQPSGYIALGRRLVNNGDVAGGQLAVFQGASEAPKMSLHKADECAFILPSIRA